MKQRIKKIPLIVRRNTYFLLKTIAVYIGVFIGCFSVVTIFLFSEDLYRVGVFISAFVPYVLVNTLIVPDQK